MMRKIKILIMGIISVLGLLFIAGCSSSSSGTAATPTVAATVASGGLVWDNWTTTEAGGAGALPSSATNKDFLRCKACHGWDGKGTDGGYVRRSATATRPNPTPTIGNISAKAMAGTVTTDDVFHVATGRLFSVENQSMPNYFQAEGLTATQASNVVDFLNNGPKVTSFVDMDIMPNPVGYSFKGSTSATTGATLYAANCETCHGAAGDSFPVDGKASIGIYMAGDGKYSEGFNKLLYGVPGTAMTRAAAGSLSPQQAADILAYVQDTFSPDYYKGGLIWDNWTTADADGAGALPAGAVDKDFLRCKACHGWDGKGLAGGYVRRSANATRPNPTATIGDLTTQMAAGTVVAADVEHVTGRAFSTQDQTMPDFTATGGLNDKQVADVVAFLNSGPKVTDHATLNIAVTPVAYTFTGTSAATGATLYAANCQTCHGTDGKNFSVDGKTGIGDYMSGDGKFSEGFNKIIYGVPGTSMTRKAVGNLTSQNAADILTYIQANLGTTFPTP